MSYQIIREELKLQYPAFGITRLQSSAPNTQRAIGCACQLFDYLVQHQSVTLTEQSISCKGAATGMGFVDGLPDIPGGFGYFIAQGRGEGFPPGERIKCCPEIAEQMLLAQPQNVMKGYQAILMEVYSTDTAPELVTLLATPDQLSGLLHLFYFRSADYDRVIVPICSGCAQLFRLPFGELRKEQPKAVIGNIDFFSRPFLDQNLFTFTVTGTAFAQMCEDAPHCCFFSPAWNGVKKRLQHKNQT